MTVLHVVGSRSAFLRLSPVIRALRSSGENQVIVYAGDRRDLTPEGFLSELDMPEPDFFLGAGGSSSAMRTGRAVIALEPIVSRSNPDWIFALGDVDAALAAALVARKNGIPLAHLEAGVRSGDETSSAEINRVLTDRLSDALFTAEPMAHDVLRREGIPADRIHFVGNVVADAVDQLHARAVELGLAHVMQLEPGSYLLALLHPDRAGNADHLADVLTALDDAAVETGHPTLLVLEHGLATDIRRYGLEHLLAPIDVVEPVGYIELLALIEAAGLVITDASEIPDVALLLGVPCIMVGSAPLHEATAAEGNGGVPASDTDRLVEATLRGLGRRIETKRPELWDGHAAERIAAVTRTRVSSHSV